MNDPRHVAVALVASGRTLTYAADATGLPLDVVHRATIDHGLRIATDTGRTDSGSVARLVARLLTDLRDARRNALRQRVKHDSADVRAWARARGHQVGETGRLPVEVVNAWLDEQEQR